MRSSNGRHPVAVVGAGPAGLAAAAALRERGVPVAIYDAGKPLSERDHAAADDLGLGVGGAGLFSDGKFSFYPSGTQLYRLANRRRLLRAYARSTDWLNAVGIPSESLPGDYRGHTRTPGSACKHYPSYYGSLAQRRELVDALSDGLHEDLHTHTHVRAVDLTGATPTIDVEHGDSGHMVRHDVSGVVLASGRFGGLDIRERRVRSSLHLRPQRVEIGIRIESPNPVGFLERSRSADVKRIWSGAGAQIRTFCTCRNGEIWHIPLAGLSALSGRSDGPPTAFSNFGLLARFSGTRLPMGLSMWEAARREALAQPTAIFEPLGDFLHPRGGPNGGSSATRRDLVAGRPWFPKDAFHRGSIRQRAGDLLHSILREAVLELLRASPDLANPEAMCLFPAVEGVGFYPTAGESLRVARERVWCAGDVVGRFRGLVPGLVSGYYAGSAAADSLRRDRVVVSLAASRGPREPATIQPGTDA